MTRTQQLQRRIQNEMRRKTRILASGDVRRMVRMQAKVLPQLLEEVEAHNEAIRQLELAARQALALKDVIEHLRLKITFRRSYSFEAYLEALVMGHRGCFVDR